MGIFRFILACFVAFEHILLELNFQDIRPFWSLDAGLAVLTFFVISGFIISLSLNKNYFLGGNYFKQSFYYYINRLLRVYPLYILSIIFFYIDLAFLNVINSKDLIILNKTQFLDYNFILFNIFLIFQHSFFNLNLVNSVAWSLDIELQWYLIAPALYYFFYFKFKLIYLRIVIYILSLLLLYAFNQILEIKSYFLEYGSYFIWGILLYDLFMIYQTKVRNFFRTDLLFFVAAILIISFLIFDFDFLSYFYWLGVGLICFTVNFKNKIDKVFGDLSYPIFILHMSILPIIFLQVNKYFLLVFNIQIYESFILIFMISLILFAGFCYTILIIFQYPLDKYRDKLKPVKVSNNKNESSVKMKSK